MVSRQTHIKEIWQTYRSKSPALHHRTSWPSLCCRCPSWKVSCRSCPDGTNCISSYKFRWHFYLQTLKVLDKIKWVLCQDGERRYWLSYSTGNNNPYVCKGLSRVFQVTLVYYIYSRYWFSVAEIVAIVNVNNEYDLQKSSSLAIDRYTLDSTLYSLQSIKPLVFFPPSFTQTQEWLLLTASSDKWVTGGHLKDSMWLQGFPWSQCSLELLKLRCIWKAFEPIACFSPFL